MSTNARVRAERPSGAVRLVYRGFEEFRIVKIGGAKADGGNIVTFQKDVPVEVSQELADELISGNGSATGDPAHAHVYEIAKGGEG